MLYSEKRAVLRELFAVIFLKMSDETTEISKRGKKFRPRKRKNKLTIVFDESARREFLTGFHKRKLQRKNKAKEEFEKQLKAERKRIKAEAKEQYMKLLLSQKAVPELSDLVSENIDMGTHCVSITELSTADLARKNNWIGINEVQYETQESNEESNYRVDEYKNDGLEGMEVKIKNNKTKSNNSNIMAKNCKVIKKKIKLQATANVKSSKVFQKKAKLEKIKNIKLKRKQERKLEKIKKKDKRSKHKNIRSNKCNI